MLDNRLDCLRLYDQVKKCIRWMSWRRMAKKDVVACDKPRGAGKQALIRGFPNGETHPTTKDASKVVMIFTLSGGGFSGRISVPEYIGCVKQTRRTETS